MNPRATAPQTLRSGLSALLKSLLLVIGVPLTLLRLLDYSATLTFTRIDLFAIHLVLGATMLLWLIALVQFTTELVRFLRDPTMAAPGSWSASWASAVVGLILLLAGLSAAGTKSPVTPPGIHQVIQAPSRGTFDLLDSSSPTITAEFVGAMGALAIAGLVRRRQQLLRSRRATREVGTAPNTPAPDLCQLDGLLRREADPQLVEWIDLINRLLGSFAMRGILPAPEVALLRVGAHGIELLLRSPRRDAPPPFIVGEGGWWWILDSTNTPSELRSLAASAPRSIRALIPLGSDGIGEILVALRGGDLLGIVGEEEMTEAAMRILVLHLRLLPWCDELAVELLGIEPPALNQMSVHLLPSSATTIAALADRPSTSGKQRDAWHREPLIVASRNGASEPVLAAIGLVNAGIAAIVEGVEGNISLVIDHDGATLLPYGLKLNPPLLHAPDDLLVERLLASYAENLAPRGSIEHLQVRSGPRTNSTDGPRLNLLHASLEIIGGHRLPDSGDAARVMELLAYLLFHQRHATRGELAQALGFESTTGGQRRIENLLSIARAVLGRDPSGREYIELHRSAEIVLSDDVLSDWQEVLDTVAAARQVDGDRASTLLRSMLSTIDTSNLLAAMTELPWFVAARRDDEIISVLVDACHHLFVLCAAVDDVEGASSALSLGGSIEPNSEILARDMMAFAGSLGEATQVEATYLALVEHLERLGGIEPSPITRRLYRSLRDASR